MWPTSSVVVVLPLEPVMATKSFGSRRQPISSSPTTRMPRRRAPATTGASCGTPGLLTTVAAPSSRSTPSEGAWTAHAGGLQLGARRRVDRLRVAPGHLRPARPQRERGGDARTREPDDQQRTRRQWRALDHAGN